AELQALGVGGDVALGRQCVGGVGQGDHAGGVQQDQRARVVAWIVGDGYVGAGRQRLQRGVAARVGAERLDVHAGDGHQVGAAALVVGLQVGLGLEVVDVDVLLRDLVVGLDVVVEHPHL